MPSLATSTHQSHENPSSIHTGPQLLLRPIVRPHNRSEQNLSAAAAGNAALADTSSSSDDPGGLKASIGGGGGARPILIRAERKAAELAAEIAAVRARREAATSSFAGAAEARDVLRRSKVSHPTLATAHIDHGTALAIEQCHRRRNPIRNQPASSATD